jgi:hypothetical protein
MTRPTPRLKRNVREEEKGHRLASVPRDSTMSDAVISCESAGRALPLLGGPAQEMQLNSMHDSAGLKKALTAGYDTSK